MAKKLKYNQTTTTKFTINGTLSMGGDYITYVEDENIINLPVEKCFAKFAGSEITLSISLKTDEDLSAEFNEEEE